MILITPSTVNGHKLGIAEMIDLRNSSDQMFLSAELSVEIAGKNDMLSQCINQAFQSNVPSRKIFAMLKDNIADNEKLVTDTIGNELVNKIKNLKL
jgi:hypothetical protein